MPVSQAVKDRLARFELEPEFQQKVDAFKREFLGSDPKTIIELFATIRQEKKLLEQKIAQHNVSLEACSQLIVERYEADGTTSMKLDSGLNCYLHTEPYSVVSDPEVLYAYLHKKRMGKLLKLPYQSMNAMNKERLTNGEPPMPGTSTFLKVSARVKGVQNVEE